VKRFLVVLSGGELRLSGGRMLVKRGERKVSVPIRLLSGLVLMGNWSVSSSLLNALLKERVPLFFLTRYGSFKGVAFSDYFPSNYRLRLAQYRAYETDKERVASFVVAEKVKAIERVFGLDLGVLKERAERTRSPEELLGIEGSASRAMFEAFKKELPEDFSFEGREYRPPKDEVNALLSLYYTFHYCLLLPLALSKGFGPYLSFLHAKRGKHASFCSDALEPLRPFLTYQVLIALKSKLFTKEDFYTESGGVFLKRESFEKFLNFFERNKEENLREAEVFFSNLEEVLRNG